VMHRKSPSCVSENTAVWAPHLGNPAGQGFTIAEASCRGEDDQTQRISARGRKTHWYVDLL